MSDTRLPLVKFLILILVASCFATVAKASPVTAYINRDPAFNRSLNGSWSFKYLPSLDAGSDGSFYDPAFSISTWKTIDVPSNWELQGFAEPSYALELKDGLGLYRRMFVVPQTWTDRRIFLRFDGVAYGFEVWINGKKVGNSVASAYNPHTFDVTDAVRLNGQNTIAVKVTTKPLGFEFDVNDDWALSGIFRDVTLFSVPKTHVRDLTTQTKLSSDGSADLSIKVELSRNEGKLTGVLFDPAGKEVKRFELSGTDTYQATVKVAKPALWTAETPALYRLRISLTAGKTILQTIEERIGLREITIADSVLLLNGRPIKLRGVNHHDMDPKLGRAVDEASLRRDIEVMKRANVNFVRTSHYPPHPRLIELCDELGLYVMDEVSIGKGEENLEKPEYRDNILARVEPTITRDKNRPSVIVWSIGNENPVTDVEMDAGRLAKKLDPSRPICYPKVGSYFQANYQRIPDFVDIYSPHYPSNATLADFAKTLKRPTIVTEYAHAQGLATDRIQDQWAIIQASSNLAGGAIWHFQDQGILRTSPTPVDKNKGTAYVWIDSTHFYDTHGGDGMDGIAYSDRTPQTDYLETRKVYSPVQIAESNAAVKSGSQKIIATIENRFDFRSLDGIKLNWSLRKNNFDLQKGVIGLNARSHEKQVVNIPVNVPKGLERDILYLQLGVFDENGHQFYERSIRLSKPQTDRIGDLPSSGDLKIDETAEKYAVNLPQGTLSVNRQSGELKIVDKTGTQLVNGIYPHSGRKLTSPEASRAKTTDNWTQTTLRQNTKPNVTVTKNGPNVRIEVSGVFPRPEFPEQSFIGSYQLDISPTGAIAVSYEYKPTNAKGTLSEAGLSIVIPKEMAEFRWIGEGPYAGYPGKDMLNEFGLFHLNSDDLYFQGNRRKTEFAMLTTAAGIGAAIYGNSGDVAVERAGNELILSQNVVIASNGNKGAGRETTIDVAKTSVIAGKLTLLPLGPKWPSTIINWFGQPRAAAKVFRPFYHSYDQ